MGAVAKPVASAFTLGISDLVLKDDVPSNDKATADSIDTNDVSADSVAGLAADKRRRAAAAGLSSTILGGSTGAAPTTSGKTLLGS